MAISGERGFTELRQRIHQFGSPYTRKWAGRRFCQCSKRLKLETMEQVYLIYWYMKFIHLAAASELCLTSISASNGDIRHSSARIINNFFLFVNFFYRLRKTVGSQSGRVGGFRGMIVMEMGRAEATSIHFKVYCYLREFKKGQSVAGDLSTGCAELGEVWEGHAVREECKRCGC